MPIQAPQWTEFLSCPICCHDFDVAVRGPISLGCGHTICRACLATLHRKQCPFDQSIINTDIENLPVNEALLQLLGNSIPIVASSASASNQQQNYQKLLPADQHANYLRAKSCIEELALYLKPCQITNTAGIGSGGGGLVSRPMQRKLVTLLGCQLVEPEGRARALRAARSLGERTVTELILQHQNPQQLSANLWAAVRARGCQFLGPAMQEEVLRLVLLALEDGSALSRKVLVMFVVQRLESQFPQASKTSIGHVVQLLYRASCFKVSKREGDSSLMQLKEEFRSYDALRREHDAQIVQIATEAGLRIAPDQWSALLYGDTTHKSQMQSIIDKLQTPQSFSQSVQELVIALQRTPDPGQLSSLRSHLELLAAIDPSPETEPPSLAECRAALEAVRIVVTALVDFVRQHGSGSTCGSNRKSVAQDSGGSGLGGGLCPGSMTGKYKVSMCRDLALRGTCPRSNNCTFAHSDTELDKYRSKNRKLSVRANSNQTELKGEKNNKVFNKQNGDLTTYHSAKVHERDTVMQHSTSVPINLENNLIDSLTSTYMLPLTSPQNLPHVNLCSVKGGTMIDSGGSSGVHYSGHYIMPAGSVSTIDYGPSLTTATNLGIWDTPQIVPANQVTTNDKKRTAVAKTMLAMLLQRKMEILNQLEMIVGKQQQQQQQQLISPQIKTQDGDLLTTPNNYSIWTSANNFRCSSGINPSPPPSASHLIDDDGPFMFPLDVSPATLPPVSKQASISRLPKTLIRSPYNGASLQHLYNEGVDPTSIPALSTAFRTPNSVTSWYYGSQPYAAVGVNGIQSVTPTSPSGGVSDNSFTGDNYVAFGRNITPESQFSRSEYTSKDLILESQKVKQQLKHLEKKINDLKLATQGATTFVTAGELAQELRMIEAGIREREKDVQNWSNPYSSSTGTATIPWIQQSSNDWLSNQEYNTDYKTEEEDTYEVGIANDMRELELRWEFELREQEKHWSSGGEKDTVTSDASKNK
ncbi:roquin-2 isoform X2 [Monomorium pharaonis]|uniref:roquin-2 isoform X2 n=1 Tax=Monomorium pharaonis TaxID=307658 RepID=UPI00063FC375|nr:roquin-2 isoform X2 [Monomorium pharaonis]